MQHSIPPLIDASDPISAHAFSHPTRHRLWVALGDQPATISQLTNQLKINKGNVAHHLGVLVAAGFVRKGPTRTVRGGTAQYYLRDRVRIDVGPGEPTRVMVGNVATELAADPRAMVNHRTLRLTTRQAKALADHLDDLVNKLEPANRRERRYGVIVGVYAQRDVSAAPAEP